MKMNWTRFNGAIISGEIEKCKGSYYVHFDIYGESVGLYCKTPFEAWNIFNKAN